MSSFHVQDTRKCAGVATAPQDALSSQPTSNSRLLAHDANSTGRPGWTSVSNTDHVFCRVYGVATAACPEMSQRQVLARSLTQQTGVMPFRHDFVSRVAGLVSLTNEASRFQLSHFNRIQNQHRLEAESTGAALVPPDVMRFEFTLPWRELRSELSGYLRSYYEALHTIGKYTPGSAEHTRLSVVLQRTNPDAMALALSTMTLFDVSKWGADASPLEEDPVLLQNADTAAQWDGVLQSRRPSSAGGGPLENGSFIPSPGVSSRPSSPDFTSDSFGFVPHDVAGTVKAVARPPRPSSLAECMDPEASRERQAATDEYRLQVLAALGLAN